LRAFGPTVVKVPLRAAHAGRPKELFFVLFGFLLGRYLCVADDPDNASAADRQRNF
jgi:hypothetical protein